VAIETNSFRSATIPTRFQGDNRTRVIYADGSYGRPVMGGGVTSQYYPDADIEAGVDPLVAVANPASTAGYIGIPYTSRLETFRIDAPETEGFDKTVGFLYLRLYKSGDIHIIRLDDDGVQDMDTLHVMPNNSSGVRKYPYSGTLKLDHQGGVRPDQSVIIEARGAEPAGIQVVAPAYDVASLT
jgi:hypothetical protein